MGEAQTAQQIEENKRHNLSVEAHNERVLAEQNRHNAVSEYQGAVNLSIDANKAAETQRHNVASEYNEAIRNQETIRHNQAQEAIDRARNAFEAAYKQAMADVSRFQSSTGAALSMAQQREINERIKKMQSDIQIAQQSNDIRAWDTASSAAKNLSNIVIDVMRMWNRDK